MENYIHSCGEHLRAPDRMRSFLIYALIGVTFSLLGWLCETLFVLILCNSFSDRGFPTLPLCPIYGFGLLAIFFTLNTPRGGVWKMIWNKPRSKVGKALAFTGCFILYALSVATLSSVIEFCTGLLFHKAFGLRMWNYTGYPLNIGGYVCLPYSAIWGALGTVVMTLLWNQLYTALVCSDEAVLKIISLALLMIIAADFIFNIIYLSISGHHINIFHRSG